MRREAMRNLHVPLPEGLYRRLRAESDRTRRAATDLAREAIDRWLTEMRRAAIHSEIAEYAAAAAGTREDLDPELESAAVEHLIASRGKKPRRGKKAR